jgi:serine/threonine protein kinase
MPWIRNDFVHLDIKPGNILYRNGHYKLGDFGLALHTVNGRAKTGCVEEGDSR